jgi:hypothetical protein
MASPALLLEASIDDKTGRTVAVYLRVRKGEVAETKKVKPGIAYADYDSAGELLGIELLDPCQVAVLDSAAPAESEAVRRFLTGSVPHELVAA